MEYIASKQNTKIKKWKSLSSKKSREESATYLVEGRHLLQDAIDAKAKFRAIFGLEEEIEKLDLILPDGVPVFTVNQMIVDYIADTKNSQGIFAEISLPTKRIDPSFVHSGQWLLLDHVSDPGNIGTLVRTADAAGFQGVIISESSADIYSPKVVRSMQGSQFHIDVANDDLSNWVKQLQHNNIEVYGTSLNGQTIDYRQLPIGADLAIILGNEAHGISEELETIVSSNIKIPIYGKAESLNVAVAGGILMYGLHG